jgi:DNA polymerase-3 subunit delta
MAKLPPREIDTFLAAPDAHVRAVLIYGPDAGLVRERCRTLMSAVAGDAADPFRIATLEAAEVRTDATRLPDEAAALSFAGGRRVVHVRGADDGLAPRFRDFLADPVGEALVIAEAGDLNARSPLRRAIESAACAVAIACYHDDARSLPTVIAEALRTHGLSASRDVIAYLADNLGGDRELTRREIEKLALYVGGASDGAGTGALQPVDLSAARQCIGDSATISLDDLAFAVGDGDLAAVERAFTRGQQEGAAPVRALRTVARHFEALHLVAGLLAQGKPLDAAIKALRRPIFWRYAQRFRAQAGSWPAPNVGLAIGRLQEAEAACKRTGAPDAALAARALLEVATKAPGRRFRRA